MEASKTEKTVDEILKEAENKKISSTESEDAE